MSGKHRAETSSPDPVTIAVMVLIFLTGVVIGRRKGDR